MHNAHESKLTALFWSPSILALFAVSLFCVIAALILYPQLASFYRWFVYLCERNTYLSSNKRWYRWKLGAIQLIKGIQQQSVAVFIKQDTVRSGRAHLAFIASAGSSPDILHDRGFTLCAPERKYKQGRLCSRLRPC